MVDKKGKTKRRYRRVACATRGGEASRKTEEAAIALARQHGAKLLFLYVVDASFAEGHTGKFPIEVVEEEVRDIGELILEQAVARAKAQGVDASSEIRQGHLAEEIQYFVEAHSELDALVVGHMSDELRKHLEPALQELRHRQLDVLVIGTHQDGTTQVGESP